MLALATLHQRRNTHPVIDYYQDYNPRSTMATLTGPIQPITLAVDLIGRKYLEQGFTTRRGFLA